MKGIHSCCSHNALTPQLDLLFWFLDATVTHNVHEEKMEDGQPAPDNVLSAIPPGFADATITHNVGLTNLAGAGIPLYCPTWFPYECSFVVLSFLNVFIWFPDATITHNVCEEKMQKGQLAPHNFLSAVASGLIIMAGAGITAMSTMGLYMLAFNISGIYLWSCHYGFTSQLNLFILFPDATATHNVHEEKMKNGQKASDNSLSMVPPGRINLSGLDFFIWIPDTTVIHDIPEEEMENGQTPPDGFLSNSAPPELINMTGDRMPHNALDIFSYDFTSLSKDELLYKPDSNEFVVGIKNYSVSAGDPPVTGMPSVETVPNTPQMSPAMIKKINDDIKYQLMKEVQRFGRNYERIFILLEEVQGSMKVKGQFVQFAIKEAARFKKVVLIQQLEKAKVKHMRKK
uniref:INTS6/SAGE1/DDX26B/CT45 C-terminal domain-containing protein n=1 Tax=Rhinopithecus roxellana TaxID=61622 RepID=A0A2K6PJ77_RHIRO